MLSPNEIDEIRQAVHNEMADIEADLQQNVGTYRYLCARAGLVFYTHTPVGKVLRIVEH